MDGSFTLRDYQRDAAEEAMLRNLLVVLPTNSGKTVIAAEVVFRMLLEHPEKKTIFVAPKRTLAMQQARLLLRHIGPLHLRSDESSNQKRNEPRWRLAVAASASSLLAEYEGDLDVVHWRHAFAEAQCVVTTAELFDRALMHCSVTMSNVSLLVLDEAHQLRGQSHYVSIMNYFYRLANTRPRVLGLTASPIEKPEASEPDAEVVKKALTELQTKLDAHVWSRRVEYGQFETRILEFDAVSAATPFQAPLFAIRSAVQGVQPSSHSRDEELRRGWAECVNKICKLGLELGDWAAMRAASMLAEDLRSGLTKLESLRTQWFARDEDSAEGDDGDEAGISASSGMWRASKRHRERLVRASDEEAERAKLHMLKATGDMLRVALDALPTPALTTVTDKVRALCNELGTKQPQKCLVFTRRRLCCRVLAAMLQEFARDPADALHGWSIGWVMSVGSLGVAPGRASDRMGIDAQAASIADFRACLRLLVSTSIVEEGIDVPECDSVISFDHAITSRELQQRRGRARAPNSAYVSMLPHGDQGAVDGQMNLNRWNLLVDLTLNGADGPPSFEIPSLGSSEAELTRVQQDVLITRSGALLSIDRAKAFLHAVYTETLTFPGHDQATVIDSTGDGSHFSTKPEHGNNFALATMHGEGGPTLFSCTLLLPYVSMCSAEGMRGQLPVRLPPSQPEPSKTRAYNRAALDGCKRLYEIGVLDESLYVVGRDDARTRLLRSAGSHVSTRRVNAYELRSMEPVVRAVPRCFQPPACLAQAAKGGEAASDSVHALWVHPIALGGEATQLSLLLSAPCPLSSAHGELRPFLVGPDGKPRQQCTLGPPTVLDLCRGQLQKLARWQVGTFDLLQGGNAGEPLHRSLRASRQLIAFLRERGSYVPHEVAWDGSVASTVKGALPRHHHQPGAGDSLVARWCRLNDATQPAPFETRVAALAKLLRPLVSREVGATHRLVCVFDLDHTLWMGRCDEWPAQNVRSLSAHQVLDDGSNRILDLFEDIPLIFAALRLAGADVALASSSMAEDSARALLKAFGLLDGVSLAMAIGDEEERDGKATHLERLSAQLGVPIEQMLLYDDSKAAVESVRRRDCGALLLSGTTGLRAVDLLRGLDMYSVALRARRDAGLDASGFTSKERAEPDYERRRKMQQERRGREGDRQAEADVAPAEEQLKQLPSEPAFWLAAPLRATGAIDWALVDEAGSLFETCAWPRLSAQMERLDDEIARPLGRCVLAHVRPGEAVSHAYLLENVEVSSDGVSGDLRRRGLNVGGDAATRMLQSDGSHKTMHTSRVTGHPLSNVEVLPLLTAQLPALRLLRRLVWRLEHISLLVEMAEQPNGPLASSWVPSGCAAVPLDLLASALTSKGASAEAMATSATADQFRHDARGCCHYEVAEWAGDAVLDLLAKAFIMTQKTVESENKLNPAAESILRNLNLRQRARALELPTAGLFAPFVAARWLPDMRRALVSKKEQADLVEALLGVLCEAQRGGGAHVHSMEQPSGELTRMFAASLAFFQGHVHPSEASVAAAEDARAFLQKTMRGLNDSRREDLERRYGPCVLEVAAPLGLGGGGGGSLRRRDLLLECCVWNKGIVFQRLEFLGDAFLQFAVSMELRKRYPDKSAGELTSIRSALVRNVHLGRLLTRRYGVATTLAFFGELEGEKERAIRAFVEEAGGDRWSVAEVMEEQLDDADEGAQAEAAGGVQVADVAPAAPMSITLGRREDLRKPTGDVYEALVGFVLLELDGDLDNTWCIFVLDFFPSASAEAEVEHRQRLDQALRAERKQIAERALRKQQLHEQSRAKRLRRAVEEAPSAPEAAFAAAPLMPTVPVSGIAVAEPPVEEVPMAEVSLLPTAEYEAALNDMPDPIGEVMKLLQGHQLATSPELSMLEEVYDHSSSLGQTHGCTLRLKRSAECLGESRGHKTKKLAKKVAYYLAYQNERLRTAVNEEAALYETSPIGVPPQPTAMPPPSSPAAAAAHATAVPPPSSPVAAAAHAPGEDPISVLARRVTIAGLDVRTFLQWDFNEHNEGGTRMYECVLTGSDGTQLGTASAPVKKAAKAAAAQRALQHLDNAAPSLLSPSQRSGPPAQDEHASGLTDSQRLILEEILLERNRGFQLKLARLMVRSGQPAEELVALAQCAHALSLQGGHSAGRRFHDEIEKMCEAAERGDLYLTSAGVEPVVDHLSANG